MLQLVNIFNNITGRIIDIILYPFLTLSPQFGLTIISIISGVLLIYIYGKVSNQSSIKKIKRKISASLLEVILYKHDITLCLKAQAAMFTSGLKYFFLALKPLLILFIPCLFILSQLNLRYGHRPLKAGESLLLSAKLNDKNNLFNVNIKASGSFNVSKPVRIEDESKVVWKITSSTENTGINLSSDELSLNLKEADNLNVNKPIFTEYTHSWIGAIFYPQPGSINQTFSGITLSYPKAEHKYLGYKLHWILFFLIISMLSGLIAAKFLKIEI